MDDHLYICIWHVLHVHLRLPLGARFRLSLLSGRGVNR
jgi:hypothetical protein